MGVQFPFFTLNSSWPGSLFNLKTMQKKNHLIFATIYKKNCLTWEETSLVAKKGDWEFWNEEQWHQNEGFEFIQLLVFTPESDKPSTL
jgi:hypothetical protein